MSKTRRAIDDAFDDDSTDDVALLEGLVVDGSRGIYRVETAEGALRCEIRGRLRKRLFYPASSTTTFHKSVQRVKVHTHDPVAVGDRVAGDGDRARHGDDRGDRGAGRGRHLPARSGRRQAAPSAPSSGLNR